MDNEFLFFIKAILFFYVGLYMGHAIETLSITENNRLAQVLINTLIIYIYYSVSKFADEIQTTYAGLFFIGAFFNSQPSMFNFSK